MQRAYEFATYRMDRSHGRQDNDEKINDFEKFPINVKFVVACQKRGSVITS